MSLLYCAYILDNGRDQSTAEAAGPPLPSIFATREFLQAAIENPLRETREEEQGAGGEGRAHAN